jgi:hypothetical protein
MPAARDALSASSARAGAVDRRDRRRRRARHGPGGSGFPAPCRAGPDRSPRPSPAAAGTRGAAHAGRTEPDQRRRAAAPLLEGTLIDTVLTNRLDGSDGRAGELPRHEPALLPQRPARADSRRRARARRDAARAGARRDAPRRGLHRLLMPDGRTYRLDQFMGLNQIGDAGLRDKVNHHYWSTFGAAGAVGLISGLAQWIGTPGSGGRRRPHGHHRRRRATPPRRPALQVMNRFLNRLPTVTIREGHRVKVYLTSDLELPAYQAWRGPGSVLRGGAMSRRRSSLLARARSVATPARAQIAVIDPPTCAGDPHRAAHAAPPTRSCGRSTAPSCGWRRGWAPGALPDSADRGHRHDAGRWEYGRPGCRAQQRRPDRRRRTGRPRCR